MEQNGFSTVTLKSWEEFQSYISGFSNHWAFRGQADAAWVLNNAIERTGFIHFYPEIESEFVAEFQRGARNYLNQDERPDKLIEWLALMQHHGAPTRLLDLTKSPYIAAYFAYEETLPTEGLNVAVWGLNVSVLRQKAIEFLRQGKDGAIQPTGDRIDEVLFEKIFYENSRSLVFPIEPFSMNRRYSLQQSLFVSTGTSARPLMEQIKFLGADLPKMMVKIELPSTCKKVALRELQKMNLNRASLFPDLDGYAISLRFRYDNRLSPDEHKQDIQAKLANKDYPFFP